MVNPDLQFDENKEQINKIKHNDIDFTEADSALDDPFAMTTEDYGDYDGEERYFTLGMSEKGRLINISWTIRGDEIRIISARLAEPHQRKNYENRR